MIKFKDLQDTFFFDTCSGIQEFVNIQACERFYDKELRKGYFDFKNEHNETLRYYVQPKRGNFTLIKEVCLG